MFEIKDADASKADTNTSKADTNTSTADTNTSTADTNTADTNTNTSKADTSTIPLCEFKSSPSSAFISYDGNCNKTNEKCSIGGQRQGQRQGQGQGQYTCIKPICIQANDIKSYSRAQSFMHIASISHSNSNSNSNSSSCCACYGPNSSDARCCGLCYFCCPTPPNKEQCFCCLNNFTEYWDSGYVQTVSGYGDEENNGVCCVFCFPLKFALFFTCCLGSIGNGWINCMRNTNLNYLC